MCTCLGVVVRLVRTQVEFGKDVEMEGVVIVGPLRFLAAEGHVEVKKPVLLIQGESLGRRSLDYQAIRCAALEVEVVKLSLRCDCIGFCVILFSPPTLPASLNCRCCRDCSNLFIQHSRLVCTHPPPPMGRL